MMRARIVFTLFLGLLASACSNREGTPLAGEQMLIKGMPYMKIPIRVMANDEYLYVEDLAPIDEEAFHCHIVKLPDLTFVRSVGRRGSGPQEITLSTPFQPYDGGVTLLDGAEGDLYRYDKSGEWIGKVHYNTDTNLDYVCVDDTVIITGDMTGKNRLLLRTPNTMTGLFSIPTEVSGKYSPKNPYLWRSYMSYNKELNRLALATQFGQIVEIYDLGTGQCILTGNRKKAPRQMMDGTGFSDIQWHRDELYVLLTLFNMKGEKKKGKSTLYRYDADGNLLQTYPMDRLLVAFSISTDGKTLWALAESEDNPVYRYSLPQ